MQAVKSTGNADDDVAMLRAIAAKQFRRPDLQNVYWVGVFGSFSRGTAQELSDIDIIVLEDIKNSYHLLPIGAVAIEDVLIPTWGRKIDMIHIEFGQEYMQGYVQAEALLSSRTVYLRDNKAYEEVTRLRHFAKSTIEHAQNLFKDILKSIQAIETSIQKVDSIEAFLKLPALEYMSIKSETFSILESLIIKPSYHPINTGFWHRGIKDANEMHSRLQKAAQDSDATHLNKCIWGLWSTPEDGFSELAFKIEKSALPTLESTMNMSVQGKDKFFVSMESGSDES